MNSDGVRLSLARSLVFVAPLAFLGGCFGANEPNDEFVVGLQLPLTLEYRFGGQAPWGVVIDGPLAASDAQGRNVTVLRWTLPDVPSGDGPGRDSDFFVDWTPAEGRIIRYGSGASWVFSHLPLHSFMVPTYPEIFTVVPAFGLAYLHELADGRYDVSMGGINWTVRTAREGTLTTWDVDGLMVSGLAVGFRYAFDSASVVPSRIELTRWDLPWLEPAHAVELQHRDGPRFYPLPPPSDPPPQSAVVRHPLYHWPTPAGATFVAPRPDRALLGNLALATALEAVARDPRTAEFLIDNPNSYLQTAGLAPDPDVPGAYAWGLVLGPGCGDGAGSAPYLLANVVMPPSPGAAVGIPGLVASGSTPCIDGLGPDLATLPPEWTELDVALAEALRHSPSGLDQDSTRVVFMSTLGCDPSNPWSVQVGVIADRTAYWSSMVSGGLVAIRTVGDLGPTELVGQSGECPPYVPF